MMQIDKLNQVEKLFESYRDTKGFSGVALMKTEQEELFHFCAGYENRAYKIENKLSTAFDTASITKLFTVAGIILLESKGLISLEDDIHSILDLQNTRIPKDVKIKHLLTHTSGIADDVEEEKGEDYSALFANSANYALRENIDFMPNFANKVPNFKAGERICYNNCAFILLGLAIEKITNKGYRQFITEEIFPTFQLKNTFFTGKDDCDRRYAEGYYYDESRNLRKNIYSFPPIGTADSGAYTTVGDLDIFIRNIKNSDVYQKMMCPQTSIRYERNDAYYTVGFGFELIEKDGKILRVHKDGHNNGVCNITIFYPQEDITFTILGNVECNIWELKSECEKILFDKAF